MSERNLATQLNLARLKSASRADLLRECNDSGLTQDELGALIGTDARGIRRLQSKRRKRADRHDLMTALRKLSSAAPALPGGDDRTRQRVGAPARSAVSQQTCSFGNESAGSHPCSNVGVADLLRTAAAVSSQHSHDGESTRLHVLTAGERTARCQPAASLVSPGVETAGAPVELAAFPWRRAA